MKKKILILFCIVFFIMGIYLIFDKKTDVKEKQKKNTLIVSLENKDYYKAMVPSIDQEYTINISEKRSFNTNIEVNENIELQKEENENKVEEMIYEEVRFQENIKEENVEITKETDVTEDNTEKLDQQEKNEITQTNNNEIKNDEIKKEINLKNGFYDENGYKYYYENDVKITGIKNIDGVDNYFSSSGKFLGVNNIKVVDVSYYQKNIDWEKFVNESDCYGVILRLGYYNTLDKKFERNISELKRLNIPYGIYLFSYSSSLEGAKKEADFTNSMITKYDLKPTLGIYYDIESWNTKTSSSNNISKDMYDKIIQYYINSISNYINYKYKVKVYSGRWYAMNRLGTISKKYVDWVAEYNSTCKYDGTYSIWQYTSKGKVPGIEGNVDISYIL